MKTLFTAALLAALLQPAFAASSYYESFDDGLAQGWTPQDASAWSILPATNGNLSYHVQAVADPTQTYLQVNTFSSRRFTDLQFAVTVANNALRPTYVLVRATDDFGSRYDEATGATTFTGTGYAFGFDCVSFIAKEYYFYKVVNGVMTTIQAWTPAPSLRCSSDITQGDRLKVVAQGNAISLYANNVLLYTYVDPMPIHGGRVGFYNVTDNVSATWSDFDDVVIRKAPASLAPAAATTPRPASTGPARGPFGQLLSAR